GAPMWVPVATKSRPGRQAANAAAIRQRCNIGTPRSPPDSRRRSGRLGADAVAPRGARDLTAHVAPVRRLVRARGALLELAEDRQRLVGAPRDQRGPDGAESEIAPRLGRLVRVAQAG